eukprot:TRINITY_DN10595_c0_g2_i1.p1 TRINITY_DN10595_c0_g2~~TRINITY_DN10595_c0_g2_i1.p1  ORF type:complete len:293 (+),score=29.52 TRINITY_DN10595_c0_g2_i1:113-991(+)
MSLNDFLNLAQLLQVFTIIRTLLTFSKYYNRHAQRLMSMTKLRPSYLFVIKAQLHSQPIFSIMVILIISMLSLAFAIRICEFPLNKVDDSQDYESFVNCIWMVAASMSTIGFGDYFPRTNPGRVVSFITAVWGVFVYALLSARMLDYLIPSVKEMKSYSIMKRLRKRKALMGKSKKFIDECFSIRKKCNRLQPVKPEKMNKFYESLISMKEAKEEYRAGLHENITLSEELFLMQVDLQDNLRKIHGLINQEQGMITQRRRIIDEESDNPNVNHFEMSFHANRPPIQQHHQEP